ncbi:hypothetical protein RND71_005520 [Anisodus tanguticus]|uniref:Uncharacterized protein n=1 Tax=Anisodus tanguticus TaxID=243964 RepID=A0AAE1VLK2_9SOLA|nr:hypothetical protein RND71_005520 [Anisodus tanguticus]
MTVIENFTLFPRRRLQAEYLSQKLKGERVFQHRDGFALCNIQSVSLVIPRFFAAATDDSLVLLLHGCVNT